MSKQVLDQFRKDIDACLDKARAMYGVKLDVEYIRLDIRGKTAGYASWRRDRNGKLVHLGLRFNHEAILKYNEDMTRDVIPHEVAHLVGFELQTDTGHGPTWKRYCRELGGDDSRCHDMVLTPAKQTEQYEYKLPSGRSIKLGPKYHANIQTGKKQYFMRAPREEIRAHHWVDWSKPAVPDLDAAPLRPIQPTPGLNIVHVSVPNVSMYATKREKALVLYKNNRDLTRKDMINLFVRHADMTPNGAATYYQTFKANGL